MRSTFSLNLLAALMGSSLAFADLQKPTHPVPGVDRSPIDLVTTPDDRWLVTANQTSDTLSLVDRSAGRVVAEVPTGRRPGGLAITPDGTTVLATAMDAGVLSRYRLADGTLEPMDAIQIAGRPVGVVVDPTGKRAYVAQQALGAVAVVDLAEGRVQTTIPVGRWPRYLALSPDGSRLAVGVNGDGGVAVVDTATSQTLFVEDFGGINLGQMQISKDGAFVYFPWMVYRRNPISPLNIQRGWVLASRIGKVRLDQAARRFAIALDPKGEAVADPHGIALGPDEEWIVCTSSGTKELLVYRAPGLPFQDHGGPGDHINAQLLADSNRFFRIPLGGRPLAVRFARDGRTVYVVNYLESSIQVVGLDKRAVVDSISLGNAGEPTLARKGEALFFDAKRSLDQWYSCHSCHYDGHANACAIDTNNDGSVYSFKTVPSLRNVAETGPWMWHGWQTSLEDAVAKSFTETMKGPKPSDEEVHAVVAYLATLKSPPHALRFTDEDRQAIERGRKVFESDKAGCAGCHPAPHFTDGLVHDVNLPSNGPYKGYNPPSLLGVYERVRFVHDARSSTLEELLTGPHRPEDLVGGEPLSPQELADLVAYLKSLE